MNIKNKKTRGGKPADIVRLDVHDWYGKVLHRIKGKNTEKHIGFAILNVVKDLYQITPSEFNQLLNNSFEEEKSELAAERLRKEWQKPIEWAYKKKS